jgi:hypothetical protein
MKINERAKAMTGLPIGDAAVSNCYYVHDLLLVLDCCHEV